MSPQVYCILANDDIHYWDEMDFGNPNHEIRVLFHGDYMEY